MNVMLVEARNLIIGVWVWACLIGAACYGIQAHGKARRNRDTTPAKLGPLDLGVVVVRRVEPTARPFDWDVTT